MQGALAIEAHSMRSMLQKRAGRAMSRDGAQNRCSPGTQHKNFVREIVRQVFIWDALEEHRSNCRIASRSDLRPKAASLSDRREGRWGPCRTGQDPEMAGT